MISSVIGEMVSRLTSDCQTMSTTVSTNLNVFLRNGVMLLGALVFMFVMSWRLSLVGLRTSRFFSLILLVLVSFYGRICFKVTFIAIPLVGFITKWYGAYYDVGSFFASLSEMHVLMNPDDRQEILTCTAF